MSAVAGRSLDGTLHKAATRLEDFFLVLLRETGEKVVGQGLLGRFIERSQPECVFGVLGETGRHIVWGLVHGRSLGPLLVEVGVFSRQLGRRHATSIDGLLLHIFRLFLLHHIQSLSVTDEREPKHLKQPATSSDRMFSGWRGSKVPSGARGCTRCWAMASSSFSRPLGGGTDPMGPNNVSTTNSGLTIVYPANTLAWSVIWAKRRRAMSSRTLAKVLAWR